MTLLGARAIVGAARAGLMMPSRGIENGSKTPSDKNAVKTDDAEEQRQARQCRHRSWGWKGRSPASTKLNGLLTHDQQNKIVEETLAKQRDDGGFSMSQLIGAWKRHDNTPLDTSSDGYATGLIAFVLEQVEAPQTQAPLKRALGWLSRNQIESDGRWPAVSLNNNRAVLSDTGLFMSDTATAYAVLALTNAPRQ